jgi:hypothetical protein
LRLPDETNGSALRTFVQITNLRLLHHPSAVAMNQLIDRRHKTSILVGKARFKPAASSPAEALSARLSD